MSTPIVPGSKASPTDSDFSVIDPPEADPVSRLLASVGKRRPAQGQGSNEDAGDSYSEGTEDEDERDGTRELRLTNPGEIIGMATADRPWTREPLFKADFMAIDGHCQAVKADTVVYRYEKEKAPAAAAAVLCVAPRNVRCRD